MPMSEASGRAGAALSGSASVERAVLRHLRRHLTSEDARTAHLLGTASVHELETRLCAHYGKRFAVLTASATSTLFALARVIGVSGREIVTPPLSWGGTVAGFLREGGVLRFADVEPATLTLSPDDVSENVGSRTTAIIAVDLFGVPADDRGLRAVADQHGLWYIHDAAQSFGATREGRPAGQHAHAIVLSFGPGKPLYAGEGGALITDDPWLYERMVAETQHPYRHLRELGLAHSFETALHARIHPLAAAWALADFDAALERLARRQAHVFQLLDVAAASGLMAHQPYAAMGLAPSFTRVAGKWAGKKEVRLLNAAVSEHGLPWEVAPLALSPLSRLPAIRRRAVFPWDCSTADAETRRRFEFIPTKPLEVA